MGILMYYYLLSFSLLFSWRNIQFSLLPFFDSIIELNLSITFDYAVLILIKTPNNPFLIVFVKDPSFYSLISFPVSVLEYVYI